MKKNKKCDFCGKINKTVEKIADPYSAEIEEIIEYYNLCDECYRERQSEI